jgi:hypothetical protein
MASYFKILFHNLLGRTEKEEKRLRSKYPNYEMRMEPASSLIRSRNSDHLTALFGSRKMNKQTVYSIYLFNSKTG